MIIDAHTHVAADQAGLAVEVMDACGIASAVVCEWHDGFGQTLLGHLEQFARHPGRFHVFGNIDFSGLDEPGFSARAAGQVRQGAAAGMRGLKVYKALGLTYRDAAGRLLHVDDERLDEAWAAAGELRIPVLLHTADPRAFWAPAGPANLWGEVLKNQPDWTYYRKGLPSRDELLAERANVIRRHGKTNFIAPHLASLEDDLPALAEALDELPNLYVDISARIPHLAATPARRQAARQFCIDCADRILFGTDTILLEERAGDIQPQTFYTPQRLPPRYAGPETLKKTSIWFYRFHRLFLETAERQCPVPFLTADASFSATGLALPPEVLEKIYSANISRLLGLTSAPESRRPSPPR